MPHGCRRAAHSGWCAYDTSKARPVCAPQPTGAAPTSRCSQLPVLPTRGVSASRADADSMIMGAEVAGTLGQRNDPGSSTFFSCLYSSSCQDGKYSKVHLRNRAWGTGTPTESAASNTQDPDGRPLLYIAHRHKDALGPIRGAP